MGAAWACGNEYALMCLPGSDIASEEFQRSVINTNQKVVHLQNVTEMKQLVETILDTFGLSYDEGLIHEKCLDFAHQISKKSEKSAYTQLWEAEKKMKQNRDLLNAYYERGNVWKKLGNYENAIKDYLFSIFLNPKNPNAYECVVKWAIEDCDKAIAMEENFWYYNTRGCSKLEKARYFEALTDFYRSHQLSPNYEPALRHLKYIVETIKPEVLLQEAENQKKSGNVLLAEIYLNCLKLTGKLSFEKR